MSHSIIIIGKHADCVIAQAVGDGDLCNATDALKSAATTLDYNLLHGLVPPLQRDAAHEALHVAQDLMIDMCDNSNLTDKVKDVEDATSAINAFL